MFNKHVRLSKWIDDGSPLDVIYLGFRQIFFKCRLCIAFTDPGLGPPSFAISWFDQLHVFHLTRSLSLQLYKPQCTHNA